TVDSGFTTAAPPIAGKPAPTTTIGRHANAYSSHWQAHQRLQQPLAGNANTYNNHWQTGIRTNRRAASP
ncbi:hypothetical protein, partial [Pseudomonas japonica]|uniref:hypothetical protein n=1 Tax=Pseudomonas japonica TaxID=256466 RepID=UPI003634933F